MLEDVRHREQALRVQSLDQFLVHSLCREPLSGDVVSPFPALAESRFFLCVQLRGRNLLHLFSFHKLKAWLMGSRPGGHLPRDLRPEWAPLLAHLLNTASPLAQAFCSDPQLPRALCSSPGMHFVFPSAPPLALPVHTGVGVIVINAPQIQRCAVLRFLPAKTLAHSLSI